MTLAVSAAEVVAKLNQPGLPITYVFSSERPVPANETATVLTRADLADHRAPAHAALLDAFGERGFGGRRRLISASLALRLGWAGGFEIGAYLMGGFLARIEEASIVLEQGLVRKIVVHAADLEPADGMTEWDRRQRMAKLLHDAALPFVRTHHEWSRLSMRALFSMIESSLAGQFVSIGEATGHGAEAAAEAEAVLGAHPVLRLDAPDIYAVEAGGRRKICQRRTLCCLYYRMPQGGYCGSCPILPDDERMIRQRKYVSEHGAPVN